ncbi:hypothetical protein H257_14258 [Aphanomyces astaci]|uniref:Myb/SANT-like domain-containing protein n=2 Tax=Aphanomyces astaci TaxID=112090 RepID=W4FRV6_APHAT|nr:hypothetical protein H257_14258 [Aphanomyces astaci]ETV70230.1 hypothetical protein H257_14258 [Aphanomyces astaci]|eukprot:XP_009840326.1 hypothetical protein H257_14258 [Aphanomyces astaci]
MLQQLKTRHDTIKGTYSVIAKIVNSSGMGWESTTCQVECRSTTSEVFLDGKQRQWGAWRHKRVPQFELCEALFRGTLARGFHDVASTDPPPSNASVDDEGRMDDVALDNDQASEQDDVQSKEDGTGRRSSYGESGKPPNKLQRHTMASQLLQSFRGMGASPERELELMAQMIKPIPVSPTSSAVKLLQEELGGVLSVEDTMLALDVLENKTHAISMQPALRETTILRQVQKLRN